uniref:Sugar phosphate transporter domain-containing protein n=1 Tax=Polytomella parva TaxID=51329 RepID=A0A7S0YDK0_9CHLO|mmetsp:Transcript_19667/g.35471  ORF Transcript_19667/g.35471 Transcript_19667/m.35471 type:complete len:350 (+) Transcript_19667:225-1274(+)
MSIIQEKNFKSVVDVEQQNAEVEIKNDGKDHAQTQLSRSSKGYPTLLVAGVCYCAASGSMVLLNKYALSSFHFTAQNSLLCFQCITAVVLSKIFSAVGAVKLQPLKRDLITLWLPVNIIFVAMIGTSFYALSHIGVGMVTVWKNLSNFVTAISEFLIFGTVYPRSLWFCLFMMLLSAIVGASTDDRFSWSGYSWQFLNCLFTSGYALYLKLVMGRTAEYTTNRQRLDEFSMVYYNNLLSVPFIILLMIVFGEFQGLLDQPALTNPWFIAVAILGGVIGYLISFSSLWFLSQTTPTIYSLVGALNKIPVALIGITVFQEPTNTKNMVSIILGLGAAVIFSQLKSTLGPKK